MARSTARKRALNTLYEADEKGQDILSLLAERIAEPGAQTPLPSYSIDIVRGVAEHGRVIDRILNDHSTGWKIRRMAVVDRNILRIATWEILFNQEVPNKVAIDEALGLAKTLSDDDAPSFIHGLLSAICADEEVMRQFSPSSPDDGEDPALQAEEIPLDSGSRGDDQAADAVTEQASNTTEKPNEEQTK
ncbi:transcription antitermination factor NusB [Bifidobacterium tsurumiense]|uniref:Transcription antitermination protein NusB n=1 Tax=Bifidobacterium tsurumiense TaxID=356829 RepID=A0A087EFM3_9BIFI|nr:transcription antitermination factor NusB [Bifidobacterium tsurumiense]KFJ06574.1 transcription termination factor [Bifidobacterium tsurumiense]